MACCGGLVQAFTRRKTLGSDVFATPLSRCLTTMDLTVLGLAQMIGAGIFVLAGSVAKDVAGPSVVVSFILAGIAAVLSAFCYAEFGSLIPRTGSAYLFCYSVLGEGIGFIVGWCVVSEQIIGGATVAKAFSGAIDSLFDNAISNATMEAVGTISVSGLSPYPDFVAILPIVATSALAISGAKITALFNNTLTVVQIIVLLFIIIAGFLYANIDNWTNTRTGGFFPYGVGGTITGAATCFFAFVGFDSIAVAGEEAKDPRKSIPLALLISMPIVCLLYFLATCSLTLMQPYYDIDILAPFAVAFESVGLTWAKYVVDVGALVALLTTLLAGAYGLPRVIYAMSSDGLLFSWLGNVNSVTKTPVYAILTSTLLIIILAVLFDLDTLVELYSIGTLISFTAVAIALIKLHYTVPDDSPLFRGYVTEDSDELQPLAVKSPTDVGKLRPFVQKLSPLPWLSSLLSVNGILLGMLTFQILFGITAAISYHGIGFDHWYIRMLLVIFTLVATFFFIVLALHQTNDHTSGFRVSTAWKKLLHYHFKPVEFKLN